MLKIRVMFVVEFRDFISHLQTAVAARRATRRRRGDGLRDRRVARAGKLLFMAEPQHALDHPLARVHARLDLGNRAVVKRRHGPRDHFSNRRRYAICDTDPAIQSMDDLVRLEAGRRHLAHG
jgi:hypothetical protein